MSDQEMYSANDADDPQEKKDPEEIEENSGIKFSGESLENYIGSNYKLSDDSYYNDTQVVAEIKDDSDGKFFFYFKKEERVFVGDCEFCYKKKVLRVLCECKRVRYCNDHCKKRDLNWHADKCTAKVDRSLNVALV